MTSIHAMFAPRTPAEFRAQYWPERPFETHGPLERLVELATCAELTSPLAMIDAGRSRLRVWLTGPDGKLRKLRQVTPADASTFVISRVGTVVIDGIDEFLAPLGGLMSQCCELLGVPRERAACNAYLSPAGVGTRMHFDQQEVIVLQLGGRKRWRFCANEQVRFPTRPYFGNSISPELRAIAAEFPTEMPEDAQEVVLEPGSLLFLPRGYWHETSTLEDSSSLSLTFATPTWLDVVLDHVRGALLPREEWRQPAFGLDESGAHREEVEAALASRLGQLAAFIAESRPARVLPRLRERHDTLPSTARLVRNRRSTMKPERREDSDRIRAVLVLGNEQGSTDIEIMPSLIPLCVWLEARTQPFTVAEARAAGGAAPPRSVDVVLSVALRFGAIESLDDGA